MDEPFSGLDYLALHRVSKFINEIVSKNTLTTFVIVTHDINAALTVADTVWLLGRDRDADGNPIPGARLQQSYNLIDRGLAWRPGVENTPQFFSTANEIRAAFTDL
jgi:polar amino acid transport system ATP-binding protein/sulfate transport system ATP-binding protein